MAQVIFKRKTTQEIETLPIVDGQLIYDTLTGQTYMDKGLERIKIGTTEKYVDGIKNNLDDEINLLTGEVSDVKQQQGIFKTEQTLQNDRIQENSTKVASLTTNIKELTTASFELANNTIYKTNDIASIIITLPSTFSNEFISELQFTSIAPTAFTIPNTVQWYGNSIKSGAFVPEKNMRYDVIFYYDGVKLRAIAQGGKNV